MLYFMRGELQPALIYFNMTVKPISALGIMFSDEPGSGLLHQRQSVCGLMALLNQSETGDKNKNYTSLLFLFWGVNEASNELCWYRCSELLQTDFFLPEQHFHINTEGKKVLQPDSEPEETTHRWFEAEILIRNKKNCIRLLKNNFLYLSLCSSIYLGSKESFWDRVKGTLILNFRWKKKRTCRNCKNIKIPKSITNWNM